MRNNATVAVTTTVGQINIRKSVGASWSPNNVLKTAMRLIINRRTTRTTTDFVKGSGVELLGTRCGGSGMTFPSISFSV
jgi:hypothetical protein